MSSSIKNIMRMYQNQTH